MLPTNLNSILRRTTVLIAAAAAAVTLLAGGCVYRPTIQQGNLLQLDEIEQVKVGMTRSQVRYVLGTPMVSDPFEPDRWDYVYTLQRGRDKHVDRAHFVVRFEADKVTSIDRLALPEDSDIARRVRAERDKKVAAEAAAEASAAQSTATPAVPPAGSGPVAEPAPAKAPDTPPPATTPPGGD